MQDTMADSPHTPAMLAFRDLLATVLNQLPEKNWAALAQYMRFFHVDLEDETEFAIALTERITHAAEALQQEGAPWPADFETISQLVAGKIPELSK